MVANKTSPRIYVASLTDYNNGILHGAWLDVTDVETLNKGIQEMLKASPTAKQEGAVAEEHAVHDYEGFGSINVSEYESLETLVAWAEGVEQHGDAYLAWVANSPRDNQEVSDFEDVFRGEWDSLGDYVADYFEQSGEYKQDSNNWFSPINYVDWERMGHDLELSGDVWTERASGGKIWVFSNQ